MTWFLLTPKNIFDMSNTALLYIKHHISMESWLQWSAHTWVLCWCQLDSWTAGERVPGCWETKAAAATTPAGRHLEDNITKHTSLRHQTGVYFILLSLFQYSYTKGKRTLLNRSNLLTSALQVNRPVRQEGVGPRRFLCVTRFAFGCRFLPAFFPLLHWGRFGWDAGAEHLLGDETISCWRGRAASAPMMQMSKTVRHFRTERTENGTTLEEVRADENQGWCTWNQGCRSDIRAHKKTLS